MACQKCGRPVGFSIELHAGTVQYCQDCLSTQSKWATQATEKILARADQCSNEIAGLLSEVGVQVAENELKWLYVHSAFLLIHYFDREASESKNATTSKLLMETLVDEIVPKLLTVREDDSEYAGARKQVLDSLNAFQIEFGSMALFPQAKGPLRGTVFWEMTRLAAEIFSTEDAKAAAARASLEPLMNSCVQATKEFQNLLQADVW